jgi:hypothetical protein
VAQGVDVDYKLLYFSKKKKKKKQQEVREKWQEEK